MKLTALTRFAAGALLLSVTARGTVLGASLSVSPSAVENDFIGTVSLSVGGIPAGKKVLIERFIDVNGDGTVDSGQDVLTFAFAVTDGQLPFIGGIRNPNVPGDDDGAINGAIRVVLPFPYVDEVLGTAAAKFIFRVSDPQNSFAPVTASFQVNQKARAQGVSGKITANGVPVPGAFVVLVFASSGSPFAATLSDASGNYSFNSPAGPLTVAAAKNGFVCDQSAGAVTVVANQFATRNVALTAGDFTVSGKVTDASTGVGLPGILVSGNSTSNVAANAFTDGNGNYVLPITAGQWRIKPDGGGLVQLGYLKLQGGVNLTATPGGSATTNFAVPKANALIYGRVKNAANQPVLALHMKADDQVRLYSAEGETFSPDGFYALGVLAGAWGVGPEGDSLIEKGYTGGTGASPNLATGEAKLVNFTVQATTAHLRGQIKDNLGAAIANMTIVVQPFPLDPTGAGSLYPSTDNNGNFDVGVRGGTWDIGLECGRAQLRGYVDISGNDFNVTDGVDQNNIALTVPVATATITGSVKDNLGNPIVGVELDANQQIDGAHSYIPGCVPTDSKGNYTINVLGGTWNVAVRNGDLNGRGFNDVSGRNVTIAGGTATANFVATPLPPEITSPTTAVGTAGLLFVYQFQTRFPAAKAVTNLPPGLSFDPNISAIVGTPSTQGTFSVGLIATNSNGADNKTLLLTVQPVPPSGPVITSSTSATGRADRPFKFQVTTTGGSPATRISATDLPPGLTLDSVTGVISGTPTTEASTAVTLTVVDGSFTATSKLQLTFTTDSALPVIISPGTASVATGQPFNYTIAAPADSDPSDATVFNLVGTLPAGLFFDPQTGVISGTFTGNPKPNSLSPDRVELSGGIVTNVQLFATNSHGTATNPLIFFLAPKGAVNISTRLAVGTGDNVLIAGFILTGNAPKQVIIRAIGPSSHVPGAMEDPTLELHDASTTLGSNDNWRDNQENEIAATTIPPTDDRESAIMAYLKVPGSYTAVVRGKNNTTGIAVVELYDLGTASLDASSNAKLAQISTRGTVLGGDDVMIGGFILSGQSSKVIVRAIGPSLNPFLPGALQDTVLELRNGSGALVAENDDWRSSQEQAIRDTTVPPSDDRESAIVATLPPGNYTGVVRGKNNTTGVALVEVYGLN